MPDTKKKIKNRTVTRGSLTTDTLSIKRNQARLRELEQEGTPLAALEAVYICSKYRWVAPEWCNLIGRALHKFKSGQVKDLNQAFDVVPSDGKKMQRMRHSFEVWKFIYLQTEDGKTHTAAKVAAEKKFNIGQRTIQRYYDSWEQSFRAFFDHGELGELKELSLIGDPPVIAK